MKHSLSFAEINVLSENISELIIGQGVVITLEMMEEYDDFLASIFKDDFGILVNKVNHYIYTYEVQLILASHPNLKAIAVVNYHEQGKYATQQIKKNRAMDKLNIKSFSGLN